MPFHAIEHVILKKKKKRFKEKISNFEDGSLNLNDKLISINGRQFCAIFYTSLANNKNPFYAIQSFEFSVMWSDKRPDWSPWKNAVILHFAHCASKCSSV